MNNPHMLYRCPGPEMFEGVRCETTVVEPEAIAEHLDAGWHRDWMAADAAHKDAAAQLAANEAEQARIAAELAAAGQSVSGLRAVHKGRGVYDVQDAEGNVVASGLTKDEAAAKAA